MAEIVTIDPTGNTLYFLVTDSSGQYWNGTAFEAYSAANIATYAVAMTEDGAVSIYRGTFPVGIEAGVYEVVVKRRAGGAPAVSDIAVGIATYIWDATTLRVNADATVANVTEWGGTAVASAYVQANAARVGGQTATAAAPVTFPANIPTADQAADAVLSRNVSNVEASSPQTSLVTLVLATTNKANTVDNPGYLKIYRTDGVTEHVSIPISIDPNADPIEGVG